jgi:hypothetical protein
MPSIDDQRPIARLSTERAELLTLNGWLRLPVADADALNRISVAVNDHLDVLGVHVQVAIKVSEKAGKRRAWVELAAAAADVDRATAWPSSLLG